MQPDMKSTIMKQLNILPQTNTNFSTLEVSSAWKGLENYLPSIIQELNVSTNKALEFGVDHGYSAHIFSQIFDEVVGVDSFIGDEHIIHEQGEPFYNTVKTRFDNTNVKIVRSSFEEFIETNDEQYDLIHIDIVHLYDPTFRCAKWSLQHSRVVLLHDTVSFPEINRVCQDLSNSLDNVNYYNIPTHFGLGILYKA